jgi:NitT/TauT family transport system ATP-binding protein
MTQMPVAEDVMLDVRDVGVSYAQRDGTTLSVLDDINLAIPRGEFVSVVGPSGCGKTTLLRVVAGLIPTESGTVELAGQFVDGPSRRTGFVFQDDLLLPWRTVIGNVLLPLELRRNVNQETRSFANELLELVGLERFAQSYPHQLSGGMRQRVNLARALVINPEVLLMDEPFAALDAQTRELLQVELLRIWTSFQKTVVFITHQIEEAVFLSDRVVVMGTAPGRVEDVVSIELGRPRSLSVKRSPEAGAYVERIWSHIASGVPA